MSWQRFKSQYLVRFWAPLPAVIAAGILSTYYFGLTGTFWAVTGEFTRWGGHLMQLFGAHPQQWGYFKVIGLEGTPLDRIDGMMIIGMFAGCIAAALWANNVKLRKPQHRIRIAQALVGGIIAGGCETGWMYRAVEGQIHYWWVGLGNIIGATILAYYWDDFAPALATNYDKVNLLETFGPIGGLLVTYLMLAIAFAAMLWWEKRFFRQQKAAASSLAKEPS